MKKLINSNNIIIGKTGENLAVSYLKDNGFIILKKNMRNVISEIDIIAKKNDRYHFIEVKTKLGRIINPREAVGYYKQQKIRKAAELFLRQNNLMESKTSFDVIEIVKDENCNYFVKSHLINVF